MHIRLFDRIKRRPLAELDTFYISGALPDAYVESAYSARVPFYGEIGDATVEEWSGTNVPAGTAISVDNTTDEIVVSWPAYVVEAPVPVAVPVVNGDFSAVTGWKLGRGWSISGGVAFYLGHGDALLESETDAPCSPGDTITLTCDVAQGASKAGNCGAAVRLTWKDADHNEIDFDTGNFVMSSDDPPFVSTVTATAPAGAAFVSAGVHGFRRRENKEMHVDNVQWNHSYTTGIAGAAHVCLSITLRDEAGRLASFADCLDMIARPGATTAGYWDSGSGNHIKTNAGPGIPLPYLGSSEFLVIGRARVATVGVGIPHGLISMRPPGYGDGFSLSIIGGKLVVRVGMNGVGIDAGFNMTSSASIPANTMRTFAWNRVGNVQTLWLEDAFGVCQPVATQTVAGYVTETVVANTRIACGTTYWDIAEHPLTGYIDWVAIKRGAGIYTGPFIPPPNAAAIAGADIALDFGGAIGSSVFTDTGSLGKTWDRGVSSVSIQLPP